jgi:hypothetical protein
VRRSWVEPISLSFALRSFWGVEYSFIRATILSVFWVLLLPCLDLPSTVILIYPSSFMSALTSVLIDRLLRLRTSFLYFENLNNLILTYSSCSKISVALEFQADV